MATESNLDDIIRRKMVRAPNLRPKVKLGQRTLGKEPLTSVQYQQLKSQYYQNPVELQPFLSYLRGRILTDKEIVDAPEGIYTWIIKRGHMYVSPLMTNQEIGSLHVNINTLTLQSENIGAINKATLKNTRDSSAKPVAGGELLLTRLVNGSIRIYFNIQSGTFSEPLLKCRMKTLAEQRGINLKSAKNLLKMECRDEMIAMISHTMTNILGIPSEEIRFLSCEESILQELEAVPFLNQGEYDMGSCRDDDDYMESIAGRNLIRRFKIYTSTTNRDRLNTYFNQVVPTASSASTAPSASTASTASSYSKAASSRKTQKAKNKTPYSKQGGKRKKYHKTGKRK